MWYTLCNLLYLKPFTRNLRLIIILLLLFSWSTRRLELRKLQLAWAYVVRFELRSSCLQSQRSNFPLNEMPVPIIPSHFLHASNVPGAFQFPSPSIFVLYHPLVHTASPPSLLGFHIKYDPSLGASGVRLWKSTQWSLLPIPFTVAETHHENMVACPL